MDRKQETRLLAGLVICLVLVAAGPAWAASPADLLEKGIYTEQTIGDLDAAIAIYSEILEQADANRPLLAEARYRLAMCQLKQGAENEAKETLSTLIRDYPGQESLLAEARRQLAALDPGLELGSVPWNDGESLTYRIKLPTGKVIGALSLGVEGVEVDGVPAWQLELQRVVFLQSENFGVSRVLVDQGSHEPIRSTIRHGVLGNAEATYGSGSARIVSDDRVVDVDAEQRLFDNEQSLHLLRMLPLETGYEGRFSMLPIWTGKVLETTLRVASREVCEVPAGEFECFRVELDLGQTYWISTDPARQVLRIDSEGVEVELVEIGWIAPGSRAPYGLKDFDFAGSLPRGWRGYAQEVLGRPNKAMIRFVDAEALSLSAVEIDRCPRRGCPSLDQTSRRELEGAERRFEAFSMRDESWAERTIDGRPAISFVSDYERNGDPWVQYRLYTFAEDKRFEFIFRTPVDRFESLRPAFDSIAESLDAR